MEKLNILAISGSLREGSFNKKLLMGAKELASESMAIEVVSIDAVPLYNTDIEQKNFPSVVSDFKQRIKEADAILIATPEYNRSFSGVLKNFFDWTSRPYGDSAWEKKIVAVLGVSIASTGTAVAQYDVKKVLTYLNCYVMGQPELYVSFPQNKFDEEGNLKDDVTKKILGEFLKSFEDYIKELKRR